MKGGKGKSIKDPVDCVDLASLLQREGSLPWAYCRWVLWRGAEVLESLHADGRTHGAVTLQNFLVKEPWPGVELGLAGESNKDKGGPRADMLALGTAVLELHTGKRALDVDHLADPDARHLLGVLLDKSQSCDSASSLLELMVDSILENPPHFEETLDDMVPHAVVAAAVAERHDEVPEPITATQTPDEALQPSPDDRPDSSILAPKVQGDSKKGSPKGLGWISAVAAAVLLGGGLVGFKMWSASERKADASRIALLEVERAEKESAEGKERERLKREEAERLSKLREEEEAKRRMAAENARKQREAEMAEKARQEALRKEAVARKDLEEINGIIDDPKATDDELKAAFSRSLQLAEENFEGAATLVGVAYWKGRGVSRNHPEAVNWFRRGSENGNARSMLGLGNALYSGLGIERDRASAVAWWQRSAAGGEGLAMARLGEFYGSDAEEGDPEKAVLWWEKAAEAGIPEAMTNLGIHHAAGISGPADLGKAIDLWKRAAALGEVRASTELGYLAFNGSLPGSEKKEAFGLFQRAASEGDPRAMTGLGVCYLTGNGVAKDIGKAKKWLAEAKDLGEPEAEKFLKQIDSSE